MAKGKTKIIRDNEGGIVVDKNGVEYDFKQPFVKELCLDEGEVVTFDIIQVNGKLEASNVKRRTVGTITAINPDNCTGTITEVEPNPKKFGTDGKPAELPFFQANLRECGFAVGDEVRYDLILTLKGIQTAVNIEPTK